MSSIVVVIPAYMAASTLPGVLARIPLRTYAELSHIVIVEDAGEGVPRSTSPELLERYSKIDILYHATNRGYGGAQKSGFRRALELGADVVVLLHADGQYAPELMADLYAPLLRDEADVVLGSRMRSWSSAFRGGMPVYKLIANVVLTAIENRAYGMHVSEFHSGYMLYNRRALSEIPFERLSDTFHFDGEMLMVAGKKRLRIADMAIPTHYGEEESHLKPFRYGLQVLGIVFKSLRGDYDF